MSSGVDVSNKPEFQIRRGPFENESNQNMFYREAGPNTQRRASIVRNHAFMPKPTVISNAVEYGRRAIDEEHKPTEESAISAWQQVNSRRSSLHVDEEPRMESESPSMGWFRNRPPIKLTARAESTHSLLGSGSDHRSQSVTRHLMPLNMDVGRRPLGRHGSMEMVERVWTSPAAHAENVKQFQDTPNQYESLNNGLFSTVLNPAPVGKFL